MQPVCLTPTAFKYFCRLKEAYQARVQWNKAVKYLRQQGEERLELEKNFFLLNCNHPSVIPHYSEWWERDWFRGSGYWCCVCQYKLKLD